MYQLVDRPRSEQYYEMKHKQQEWHTNLSQSSLHEGATSPLLRRSQRVRSLQPLASFDQPQRHDRSSTKCTSQRGEEYKPPLLPHTKSRELSATTNRLGAQSPKSNKQKQFTKQAQSKLKMNRKWEKWERERECSSATKPSKMSSTKSPSQILKWMILGGWGGVNESYECVCSELGRQKWVEGWAGINTTLTKTSCYCSKSTLSKLLT